MFAAKSKNIKKGQTFATHGELEDQRRQQSKELHDIKAEVGDIICGHRKNGIANICTHF